LKPMLEQLLLYGFVLRLRKGHESTESLQIGHRSFAIG
jgi:hypothetical protein